tara:strand:- start:811 stop:978 length:168 start_codon:yes stop_codon:yes gene_type:complete
MKSAAPKFEKWRTHQFHRRTIAARTIGIVTIHPGKFFKQKPALGSSTAIFVHGHI